MFSYGSSARAGVGRRSHGGRPYRPPPKQRRNVDAPPLKECTCLIELLVPEYQTVEPLGRQHLCFGGRESMEFCQRTLRSSYHAHLMVPGKKQMGPLSLISKSFQEAIPALTWLLEQWDASGSESLEGRIYRDVREGRDSVLRGVFPSHRMHSQDGSSNSDDSLSSSSLSSSQPFWLFQSPTWAVLACRLDLDNRSDRGETDTIMSVSAMKTCVDNIVFQLGQEAVGQVITFVDDCQEYAFAVGDPEQVDVLRNEIMKMWFAIPGSSE